jgi:mRNA interferase HicA
LAVQVREMTAGKLPSLTVAEVQRALLRDGWYVKRQGGNHQILTHRDTGGRVVIPRQARQTLKPKTLQSIVDQAGMSVERMRDLL